MTDLIEVKTSDLVGEQLAWAVAKAEGLAVYLEGMHRKLKQFQARFAA